MRRFKALRLNLSRFVKQHKRLGSRSNKKPPRRVGNSIVLTAKKVSGIINL